MTTLSHAFRYLRSLWKPAALLPVALVATTASVFAQSTNIFANAQTAGTNLASQGVNAMVAILLAFGGAGLVLGGFGMWKQPEKRAMWGHVMEGAAVPLILGIIGMAYESGAPSLLNQFH